MLGEGVLKETSDPQELRARVEKVAGAEALERALDAHHQRVR